MVNQSYNTFELIQSSFSAIAQPEWYTDLSWQIRVIRVIRVIVQSKLTDYVRTAKIEHIILLKNGSRLCMNSINLVMHE